MQIPKKNFQGNPETTGNRKTRALEETQVSDTYHYRKQQAASLPDTHIIHLTSNTYLLQRLPPNTYAQLSTNKYMTREEKKRQEGGNVFKLQKIKDKEKNLKRNQRKECFTYRRTQKLHLTPGDDTSKEETEGKLTLRVITENFNFMS